MANHMSAKKAYRSSLKKKRFNSDRLSSIKTLSRKIMKLISLKELESVKTLFVTYQSLVSKAVNKKIFNLNNASRKVSKMSKRIKLLSNSLS